MKREPHKERDTNRNQNDKYIIIETHKFVSLASPHHLSPAYIHIRGFPTTVKEDSKDNKHRNVR